MRERSKQASGIWWRSRWLGLVITATFLGSSGCANQAKCDPGYELGGSRCVPVEQVSPDEPGGGAGAGGAPAELDGSDPSASPAVEPGSTPSMPTRRAASLE